MGAWLHAESEARHVLVLHSYHQAAWCEQLNDGIRSVFDDPADTALHFEYMDTKRAKSRAYFAALASAYAIKWQAGRPDLVLTSDDNALGFALEHRPELWPAAPIVFCGVNRYEPELIAGHAQVTGVVERGDFAPTLRWLLQVRPTTERLLVICDDTTTGRINKQQFDTVLAEHFPALNTAGTGTLSCAQLADRLRSGQSSEAAFFISFWRDGHGRSVTPEELEQIFTVSSIPVLGRSEWMIGRGMLGGKCVSGFAQGSAAAGLAEQILAGEPIPPVITDSPNVFMFDHVELAHHGLEGVPLPPDAFVVNRPSDMLPIDRVSLAILVSMVIALSISSISLLLYARQRRRAQQEISRSAAQLHALVESLGEAVVVHDAETGSIIEANGRCLEMYGCSWTEFVSAGAEVFSAGPPNFNGSAVKARLAAAQAGQAQFFEWHARRHDGTLFWVEIDLRPADLAGRACIIATIRDISRRKAVEQERTLLFQHSNELLSIADRDFRFRVVNPACTTVLGWTETDLAGAAWLDFVHPDDYDEAVAAIGRLSQAKPMHGFVCRFHCRNGGWRLLSWNAILLDDHHRIFAVARDVTDERRLQEELHQAQKLESVGRLAGGVAHDFNNMLLGILGGSELLQLQLSAHDDPQVLQTLAIIHSSAERAADLTRQLLTVGRKSPIDFQPIDLNEVVQQVCDILRRTIDRRIIVQTDLREPVVTVLGDRGLLHAAVLNLAVNARDMLPEGGVIRFRTGLIDDRMAASEHRESVAYLSVADSGSGIDPAIRDRIFEPFFTTKPIGQGTGLGLSATYASIVEHGGRIEVDVAPEGGARFTIMLPHHPAAMATPTSDHAPLSGSGHLLVIDDEQHVRTMAKTMLEELGYRVTVADGPSKALEIFSDQHEDIDLVLLDLVMPDLSGEQVFYRLRDIDQSVRVVLNSGYDVFGGQAANLVDEEQVAGFLRKPYSLAQLGQTIAMALRPIDRSGQA